MFNSRVRNTNEMVSTYLAELQKLTEHCEYGDSLSEIPRE